MIVQVKCFLINSEQIYWVYYAGFGFNSMYGDWTVWLINVSNIAYDNYYYYMKIYKMQISITKCTSNQVA